MFQGSIWWQNCRLNVALAAIGPLHHMTKYLRQFRQRGAGGDVIRRSDPILADKSKGFTYRLRGVMEGRQHAQRRVVDPVGIKLNPGAASAAAKNLYGPALRNNITR